MKNLALMTGFNQGLKCTGSQRGEDPALSNVPVLCRRSVKLVAATASMLHC